MGEIVQKIEQKRAKKRANETEPWQNRAKAKVSPNFSLGSPLPDLEGALAVHFNLPLLSFYLYTTFKTGIAPACEPFPFE